MRLLPYFIFWGALAGVLVAFAPKGPQNGTRGGNTPCSGGGPPDYCANSTRSLVPETPMPAPAVNAPFKDPDFGSRMVRVTGPQVLDDTPGFGGEFDGISYMTDSSAEANTWGKFDPALGSHGGYRFAVSNAHGWTSFFTLDATTMHVSRLPGRRGGFMGAAGVFAGGISFSYTDPDVLYTVSKGKLEEVHLSTGRATALYTFTSCPGLPRYTAGYGGGLTNSADSQKFGEYFGGRQQNYTTFAVYYDRSANGGAGACYWYDTVHGLVGGTNMQPTPVANHVGQLAPPPAPQVTASPGSGSLPAGDYYVELTALTQVYPHDGETTASSESGPIHLSAPGSLRITFPSRLSDPDEMRVAGPDCAAWRNLKGCTPFNVYIGTARGGEMLQNVRGPAGGADYVQSTPLNTSSARPPQASSAGFNVHNARLNKDGSYLRVDAAEGFTLYYWKSGTNHVASCTLSGDACGGHQALGYNYFINDPDNHDSAEVIKRPFADPKHYTELVRPLLTPPTWNSSHWTWNNDNPSDTMPVCGSFWNSYNYHGNGTQNVLTNTLLKITRAYDREIVCVATTGPSRVWRFAHNRATGAANANARANSNFWAEPRGNVSQDGKFYMFTSDWDWSLGSAKGHPGCPAAGECRTDVFIVELH